MARKQRKQTAQKKQKQEKQKKPRKTQPGTRPLRNSKARDSTAKLVLGDPYLCAQFLRDYVGLDIMQDVRPEDIQDVSERFLPMFVDERHGPRDERRAECRKKHPHHPQHASNYIILRRGAHSIWKTDWALGCRLAIPTPTPYYLIPM